MKRAAFALGLLFLLGATPARAVGVGKGEGEIGFDFGYAKFDSDLTDHAGGRFVVRGGYFFSDLFELEGQDGGQGVSDNGVDTTLGTFFVNGVFNFHPSKTVVPYVLGGIGAAKLKQDLGSFNEDDTGRAYQVAGGSRFFFGKKDRSCVRVEAAWIHYNVFDVDLDNFTMVAGFSWTLGHGK